VIAALGWAGAGVDFVMNGGEKVDGGSGGDEKTKSADYSS